MRVILFCSILLLVGSQANGATLSTTGWPTTGNCSLPDPTRPCDQIIVAMTADTSNMTAAAKLHKKLITVAAGFVVGDSTFESYRPDLCLGADWYKKCIDKTLTDCASNRNATTKVGEKRKIIKILGKFIQEKVCKTTTLSDKFKSYDFSKCFSGSGASSKSAARDLIKKQFEKIAGNKQRGTCNGANMIARQAGTKIEGIRKKLNNKQANCADKLKKLIGFMAPFFGSCESITDSNRGTPKDKKRLTCSFFSLNHRRIIGESSATTCADESAPRNETLFETDFLKIDCELRPISDNGVQNTQCRAAYLLIRDSSYAEVAFKALYADKSFSGTEMKIAKGNQKSGGKLDGEVRFKPQSSQVFKAEDKNNGVFLKVRRIGYSKDGGKTLHYLLIVTIRAGDSIFKGGIGACTQKCTNAKDISAPSGRRKRSALSNAAQIASYDVRATGDPNAGDIVTEAGKDFDEASQSDSEFTSACQSLIPKPLLLLVLLVSALSL